MTAKHVFDWIETYNYSPIMNALYQQIRKVAAVDVNVLLLGETGTGKELAARSIHAQSHRKDKPFIAINCAALSDTLIESQLFGYKKGSFTDAIADHPGYFLSADGGTLFLDEIGELSLQSQVKILRVLQEYQVTALGTNETQTIDIRLICATHVNLPKAIIEQRFREDLYYRINTIDLKIPPLRDRGEEIIVLAQYFIEEFSKKNHLPIKSISSKAQSLLLNYPWPGNVRELQNTIAQAMIFSHSKIIKAQDLKIDANLKHIEVIPLAEAKDKFIKSYIQDVLDQCGGNRQRTAKALKVNVRTIFRYLEK